MHPKFIIYFLLVATNALMAQDTKQTKIQNKVPATLSIGVTASLFSRLAFVDTSREVYRQQKIPPINISYCFSSKSGFTFGPTLFVEDYKFYKIVSRRRGNLSDLQDNFVRINTGIKAGYHYLKNTNEYYGNLRIGYEFFNINMNQTKIFNKNLRNKYTLQASLGVVKYVGNYGLNLEFAIGRPYWATVGICIKLNNGL